MGAGSLSTVSHAQEFVETDICIYGGTSGGVTAAVQAARMGKRVALVVCNNHLGGMTSSGLGWTDIGQHGNSYIQGLAREFYLRIGAKYNQSGAKFTFEPKVAEAVFNEMLQEEGIPIYLNQRLASTQRSGLRIVTMTMENGNVFRAKMFIDCTYEGDLMAKAGVSYLVGRESNAQYGETLNGMRDTTGGLNGIDPYMISGNPASGLLPRVNAALGGPNGTADNLVQAYNYRMCLTDNPDPTKRIVVPQPPDYNESDYEILFRAIAAGQTTFWNNESMPNRKTDSNSSGEISTDYVGGGSQEWVEASYARRDEIARAHEKWQRGLIWTVQNHPRVPAAIRTAWSKWGLAADEFVDTDHWPHQLYVREARRMISDYVMTEHNCQGTLIAADSIGLAAYKMDSHVVQRHNRSGMVKGEGGFLVAIPGPYPISYRSIVPATGQCENLLVTFALSASHVAFGSCRMEPVYMITSQSAAAAAAFAIDDAISVQNVSYGKLKAQLLADGQRLTWSTPASNEIVLDNSDSSGITLTGSWSTSTATAGYFGSNYFHDGNVNKGTKSVQYQPQIPASGIYEVRVRWTADPNRATNVPIDIVHQAGTTTLTVNQEQQGGQWVSLGSYSFSAGNSSRVVIRTTGTNGYVIADAVSFSPAQSTVSLWATNGSPQEPLSSIVPPCSGLVTIARTGSLTSPLTVNLSIGGTAINGTDYLGVSSIVTIPAGTASVTVSFVPLNDERAEGPETISVQLAEGSGYFIDSSLHTAIFSIQDRPFDAWRKSMFSSSQLGNPALSGDTADMDSDGSATLAEFISGTNPTVSDQRAIGTSGIMTFGSLDYLNFTFTRTKAVDVVVTPQVSSDLVQWSSAGTDVTQSIIADDGNIQTIVVRDTLSLQSHPRRFLRLQIQRAP